MKVRAKNFIKQHNLNSKRKRMGIESGRKPGRLGPSSVQKKCKTQPCTGLLVFWFLFPSQGILFFYCRIDKRNAPSTAGSPSSTLTLKHVQETLDSRRQRRQTKSTTNHHFAPHPFVASMLSNLDGANETVVVRALASNVKKSMSQEHTLPSLLV